MELCSAITVSAIAAFFMYIILMKEGEKAMKYPRKIAIGFQEGTCPLRCAKCYAFSENARGQKKPAKMPMERAIWLIDEIAHMEQVPSIQPHIYTEPFANDDLHEIIQKCLDYNICMSIISNGILLNQDWLDFLLNKLDRRYTLSFSLDAVTQDTYEKVRGAYELGKIEERINYLISNRGNSGPRVGVNFSVEEDNYAEVKDFLNKWKYKVDAVRINTVFDFDKRIPPRFRKEEDDRNIKCAYLDEVMTIDADGQVRTCQYDAFGDTALGNVFEEGILNVWNGDKISGLRRRQERGELETDNFCYGCDASKGMDFKEIESDEFLIKKASQSIYYNYRGEIV